MDSEALHVIYNLKDNVSITEKMTAELGKGYDFVAVIDNRQLEQNLRRRPLSLVITEPRRILRDPKVLSLLKDRWQKEKLLLVWHTTDHSSSVLPERWHREMIYDHLRPDTPPEGVIRLIQNARALLLAKQEIRRLSKRLELQAQELHELNQIGIALSAEHDPHCLLDMILQKSREITSADAGSLYLVETIPDIPPDEDNFLANKQLRFKLSHNDSLNLSYNEFIMPIEMKSMAGYVALTGEPLNIEDAYEIPEDAEFSHNRSFDLKTGYRTKSILGIPMRTHKGEIIGVLQLINRKKHWDATLKTPETIAREILPFDDKCVHLASSLASQAAVSVENTRLYEEIKNLFEGFIRASVLAIEQRDPTTYGHSERVATLSVGLAETADIENQGPYRDLRFSRNELQEIKYAGLLHDFGKIGVREHVLVKAKKLYPAQLDLIKARFRYIKRALELNYSTEKIQHFLKESRKQALQQCEVLDDKFAKDLKELDDDLEFILRTNEPTVLQEGGFERLLEIADLTLQENGEVEHYLNEDEVHLLSITKGSLSEEERKEVESHVIHTFSFLSKIPWTSELKSVPQIAHAHHEKLDGSGYPLKLTSPEIPVQSKMMAIADIYDALTAWDRPYKRAIPPEKALDILGFEVKDGHLDAELFRLFVEAEVYKLVSRPQRTS